MRWICCLAAGWCAAAQCLPVEEEFIRARQFQAADPPFAALAPDVVLARAPVAGTRYVARPEELRRLAAAHGISAVAPKEVCFEWPLVALDPERVLHEMRASLQSPEARLELIDFARGPAPKGELVFPKSSLSPAPDGTFVWRGFVRYGADRRFPVWARLRVLVREQRVLARADLAAGTIVGADLVVEQTLDVPLGQTGFPASAADVAGKKVRRGVRAGAAVSAGDLVDAPLVIAGQTVEVELRNGPFRLRAIGQAEQAGRKGEFVSVRNTVSGTRFRARVEQPGKVSLTLAAADSRYP